MKYLKQSVFTALWLAFVTFPIMVIKVDTIEKTIQWRWINLAYIMVGVFAFSMLWRYMMERRDRGGSRPKAGCGADADACGKTEELPLASRISRDPNVRKAVIVTLGAIALALPFISSTYQTNIMTSFLLYICLGLGLNIVVGLAGLLDLGYVAFYAVGAYSYALLNHHFGLDFWLILPIGGVLGAIFGVLLGFPVLRLRGDYLAIVTLGFGEIIRLVLENWSSFSQGPSGISGIDRPGLFGYEMNISEVTTYVYYLMLVMVLLTILFVNRLKNSRIGRAWLALREDEIACQAMGIDKIKTKLMAFGLGATWAGFAGVVFAAKTTFINPASFTFLESAIILAIVVVGGMGSIFGVILGAAVLILLPEYMRAFSEYRMLLFGATMVLVMVFRPQGLIASERRKYKVQAAEADKQAALAGEGA